MEYRVESREARREVEPIDQGQLFLRYDERSNVPIA
jgi:hypothetical protein